MASSNDEGRREAVQYGDQQVERGQGGEAHPTGKSPRDRIRDRSLRNAMSSAWGSCGCRSAGISPRARPCAIPRCAAAAARRVPGPEFLLQPLVERGACLVLRSMRGRLPAGPETETGGFAVGGHIARPRDGVAATLRFSLAGG
jgi:hypothetical protein